MKLESYWTDSAPLFISPTRELPTQVDVAIVGGGFTGLSAALALAARGLGGRAGSRPACGR
jgi:pyruvate/2-oxoglutarate dehydrogenase complex dihydrolipoamide dehydrogenase (E3) component